EIDEIALRLRRGRSKLLDQRRVGLRRKRLHRRSQKQDRDDDDRQRDIPTRCDRSIRHGAVDGARNDAETFTGLHGCSLPLLRIASAPAVRSKLDRARWKQIFAVQGRALYWSHGLGPW